MWFVCLLVCFWIQLQQSHILHLCSYKPHRRHQRRTVVRHLLTSTDENIWCLKNTIVSPSLFGERSLSSHSDAHIPCRASAPVRTISIFSSDAGKFLLTGTKPLYPPSLCVYPIRPYQAHKYPYVHCHVRAQFCFWCQHKQKKHGLEAAFRELSCCLVTVGACQVGFGGLPETMLLQCTSNQHKTGRSLFAYRVTFWSLYLSLWFSFIVLLFSRGS